MFAFFKAIYKFCTRKSCFFLDCLSLNELAFVANNAADSLQLWCCILCFNFNRTMLNDCVLIRAIAVFTVKRTSSESVHAVDLILSIDSQEFFEMLVVLTLIKFRRALIRLSV